MKTITIIGWSAKARAVVEDVRYWPDEMDMNLAVAKSGNLTNLMTIEEVLVEEEEPESIRKMKEMLDEEEKEMDKVISKPLSEL